MGEKNRRNLVFIVVAAIALIVVTLGATYAYFTAQSNGWGNIDTDVITGTTDNLSFSFGDLINIYATEENFGQGMGSISDSTTGRAILRANNTTNTATANYNIYLIIEKNDFVYTTKEGTPEILLNVTDPNGNEVKNITGLVHYENGFDITTRTGGFLLVPDYEINASDIQTIQDWNIEVTLVNLDSDQNANAGKNLTGRLYITQEQMNSYELTEINAIDAVTTYNTIDATLNLTNGSAIVSKYYYGIEKTSEILSYNSYNSAHKLSNVLAGVADIEYVESDTPNYEFTGLEANTEYTIYSYVEDENKIKSNVYQTNITTKEYELPVVNNINYSTTTNSITLTVNASNGSNEIIKYMYSKDNGDTWVESISNTYIFTDLIDSTKYDIKVKVLDSENVESTEYYEAITTEVYILPVVSSVNATTTWNSITLTPSGTNGTNTIDHYEYSINNGAYQTSNVFSNLTDNTSYTIRVKAIDTAGRESNIYEITVRTDAYVLPTISVSALSTSDSITINVNATPGDGNIVSYYYSRDDGSNYSSSTGNSFTFANLTSETTYYLKVYVTDSNGKTSSVYSINVQTKQSFASYIISTYNGGTNGLYYHNMSLANGAQDNSYRFTGSNPNNYVCFGTDVTTCPTDNLYRIIGVFGNQIKLIKNTSLGDYYWSGSSSNTSNNWSDSTLNKNILNGTYLTQLGLWADKIDVSTWKTSGVAWSESYNAKQFYDDEIKNGTGNYSAKVGLMYVSDFAYSMNNSYWTTPIYDYLVFDSPNWIATGSNEWTITKDTSETANVFIQHIVGALGRRDVNSGQEQTRPVFYLKSNVGYLSGDGTQANPYILS